MNRRECLGLIGSVSASALFDSQLLTAQSHSSLKDIARSRGFLYGAQSEEKIPTQPPAYGQLYLSQCELMATNMSWKYISPSPGVEEFTRDANIAWAASHGLRFTGGHLLWSKTMPAWLDPGTPNAEFKTIVNSHIQNAIKKCPGKTFSWNVVNEAIEPKDGRPDGLRDCDFIQKMGANFFDDAFRTARASGTDALLVYNDAGIEFNNNRGNAKRAAYLRLMDQWKKQGTPVDAIGLQTHVAVESMREFDERIYRNFLKSIADHGYRIILTELDVRDIGAPTAIDARDRAVADTYRRVLDVALDETATCAVVTWGLSDAATWYNKKQATSFTRSDGTLQRPLLFDQDLKPKAALDALQRAFQSAPTRKLPPNA